MNLYNHVDVIAFARNAFPHRLVPCPLLCSLHKTNNFSSKSDGIWQIHVGSVRAASDAVCATTDVATGSAAFTVVAGSADAVAVDNDSDEVVPSQCVEIHSGRYHLLSVKSKAKAIVNMT